MYLSITSIQGSSNPHLMKRKLASLITSFALLIPGLVTATVIDAPLAHAAGCGNAPASTLGTDDVTYSIPTAGTYTIWSRIQSDTATNNSYYLQIDCGSPISVGGANLTADTWTWVNYKDGNTASKITATLTAGSHDFFLTGEDPGVIVDRVIFATDANCVPTGTGDNCAVPASTPTPTATPTPTPTATPTPTPTTVGDVNGDGHVSVIDLSILLSHWGTNYSAADFNHDGTVNVIDLSVLLSHWTG